MLNRSVLIETEEPKDKKPDNSLLVALGTYGAVGLQLFVSVAVGVYGGGALDKKLGTDPWFTIGGLVLGGPAGFYNLFRLTKVANKNNKKNSS